MSLCSWSWTRPDNSQAFRVTLLPGMAVQSVFTVPKKGSTKLHLVNDHSARLKSLNSLILMDGGFVVLDNLSDLGANIHATMHKNPNLRPRLLWKSNALQAYRDGSQCTHAGKSNKRPSSMTNTMLITAWYLGITLRVSSGASSLGLCAGSASTNAVLRVSFTMLMMPSTCHLVMNFHSMHHTGASCQLISAASSISLTILGSPTRIRSSFMGSHSRLSA